MRPAMELHSARRGILGPGIHIIWEGGDPLPDLRVEPGLFCAAQDLLILYDDCPTLVGVDELADLVLGMPIEPDWSCPDVP